MQSAITMCFPTAANCQTRQRRLRRATLVVLVLVLVGVLTQAMGIWTKVHVLMV